jgi:hypothetical protein
MQSSGASTFAYLLGQHPGCLAFVDVFSFFAAPEIDYAGDIVSKVVVTTAFPLSVHQERFRPDHTVLILRDPCDNYHSLRAKHYRNHDGLMEEKFEILEQLFINRELFEDVWYYEDLVFHTRFLIRRIKRLGWPWSDDYLRFSRRPEDLEEAIWKSEPKIYDRLQFGMGHIQPGGIRTDTVPFHREPKLSAQVKTLCPMLSRHYDSLRMTRWPSVTATTASGGGVDGVCKGRSWLLRRRAAYYLYLARWLLIHGQVESAERSALTALDLDPAATNARLILCRALRRQCRLADARAAAEEACRRSPEMPAAYAELAESFLLENQPAEAERSIRRALELKACEPEYHCILGKALSSQDRLDDAIAAMEEALRLNAASPRVRQELERLRQIHDSR